MADSLGKPFDTQALIDKVTELAKAPARAVRAPVESLAPPIASDIAIDVGEPLTLRVPIGVLLVSDPGKTGGQQRKHRCHHHQSRPHPHHGQAYRGTRQNAQDSK